MALQRGKRGLALIDIIRRAAIVQPQLSESWPEKTKQKKSFFSQEEKGGFDPKWEPGAERRSPCVQFLAVMKCHAWKNRPNLGLQKQFGMMEGELEVNELGGRGEEEMVAENRRDLGSLCAGDAGVAGWKPS